MNRESITKPELDSLKRKNITTSMNPKQPEFDVITVCCRGIQARLDSTYPRLGRAAANKMAATYVTGFAHALIAAGYDVTPLNLWIEHTFIWHGMRAVKEILDEVGGR